MIMLQNCQQVNKKKKKMFTHFAWFLRKLRKYKEIIELYYCLIFMVLSRDMFQVKLSGRQVKCHIYIYVYMCVCVCVYIVKPQNEEKFMFESQIFGLRVLEFHVIDYYECKFYQDCDCLVGIFGTRCCKSM
jgi:hypothetical protein